MVEDPFTPLGAEEARALYDAIEVTTVARTPSTLLIWYQHALLLTSLIYPNTPFDRSTGAGGAVEGQKRARRFGAKGSAPVPRGPAGLVRSAAADLPLHRAGAEVRQVFDARAQGD